MDMRWFLLLACIFSHVVLITCDSSTTSPSMVDSSMVDSSPSMVDSSMVDSSPSMVDSSTVDSSTTTPWYRAVKRNPECLSAYRNCFLFTLDDKRQLFQFTVESRGPDDEESGYEPQENATNPNDNPSVQCIILRPSAIKKFEAIESRFRGISEIKYKVLEEIIDYMNLVDFRPEGCRSEIVLLDLAVFAARQVKAQYKKIAEEKCVYKVVSYTDETSMTTKTATTPLTKRISPPCEPTESPKTPCPKDTKRPDVTTLKPQTERPCPNQTEEPEVTTPGCKPTESPTADPCREEASTTEATKKPCPERTEEPEVTTPGCKPTESPTADPCREEASTTEATKKPCPEQTGEPEVTTPGCKPTESTTAKPCAEDSSTTGTTENPCEEEEIIAEEYDYPPPLFGSLRGIPGVHFPNYSEVPLTSFNCADMKYIPGFYADLDTGCQVFHVCYEHRRESFLCPVGTVFNQPILACDYWYSSNCSLAPFYYEVNAKTDSINDEEVPSEIKDIISVIIENNVSEKTPKPKKQVLDIAKFLPVKATVVELPRTEETKVEAPKKPEVQDVEDIASDIFDKIVSTATRVASKTREVVAKIPEPSQPESLKPKIQGYEVPKFKVKPVEVPLGKAAAAVTKAKLAAAVPPIIGKAKLAAAAPSVKAAAVKSAVPVAVKAAAVKSAVPVAVKAAAVKSAVPIAVKAKAAAAVPVFATKAKIAAVKSAVPVAVKAKAAPVFATKAKAAAAKTKFAASVPVAAKVKLAASAPKLIAKASIPALKAKMIASAVPLAKAKFSAPVFKGKAFKAAALPMIKAKGLAVPLAKSKLAGGAPILKAKMVKAAAISPLTKKALALGYMKLLKTKKLALMG